MQTGTVSQAGVPHEFTFYVSRFTPAYIILSNVSAISLGVAATSMPAALNAAIFAAAVPLPPLTMAPAWPMRRPGGAVAPAIKPATGFLPCCLIAKATFVAMQTRVPGNGR